MVFFLTISNSLHRAEDGLMLWGLRALTCFLKIKTHMDLFHFKNISHQST